MNIRITDPLLEGQQAKLVCDDDTRVPHTWYINGRELYRKLLPAALAGRLTDECFDAMRRDGLTVEIVAQRAQSGGDRVALFCKWYKHFKGLAYKATPADGKRLKDLGSDLSEQLLKFYLDDQHMPDTPTTWLFKGKQSVGNLLRYWNEVQAAMSAPPPSKHPDHWSREHLNRLDGPGITEYYRHLKSLGLKAVTHRDGTILEFRKP